jgi:hypothetical protein
MNTRMMGLALAIGASVGWVAGCEVEQPAGACKASHSSNYAIFDLTSTTGTGECTALTGDFVFMSKYNEPGTDVARLSLSVDTIAGALTGDERISEFQSLTHLGDYPEEPTDGVCVAPTLSPVAVNIPASGDPADGGDPAVNVTYNFSNVRVVSTALVPGTQWTANLEYTAGGCTATYNVVGISPLVTCHEVFINADDEVKPVLNEQGMPIMAPAKCDPVVLDGRRSAAVSDLTGETTNIAFDLVCDPTPRLCSGDLCHVCRPNGEVPALRND